MSNKDDGGPVFPFEYHNQTDRHQPSFVSDDTLAPGAAEQHSGMTLREWYKGMALQGLLAAQIHGFNDMPDKGPFVEMASRLADKMLAEDEAFRATQ